MANFAANAKLEYPPGNAHWNYTSQTANILAAVARGQFDNDQSTNLDHRPVRAHRRQQRDAGDRHRRHLGGLLPSMGDAVRLGQVRPTRVEGRGVGRQNRMPPPAGWWHSPPPVLPPATAPATAPRPGCRTTKFGGECPEHPRVPADTVAIWKVTAEDRHGAVQQAVIVRLGWTFPTAPNSTTASSSRTCSKTLPDASAQ